MRIKWNYFGKTQLSFWAQKEIFVSLLHKFNTLLIPTYFLVLYLFTLLSLPYNLTFPMRQIEVLSGEKRQLTMRMPLCPFGKMIVIRCPLCWYHMSFICTNHLKSPIWNKVLPNLWAAEYWCLLESLITCYGKTAPILRISSRII